MSILNKGSKTPFYVINGVAMNKQQVEERLSDEDFVANLRNGRIDVRIKNDKEMQSRFNDVVKVEKETVPAKQKGRLTKFSTPQDGIVGEVTYEDGTKKELTQEEYDALEKQEGLFDVETGTQPVTEAVPAETPSEVVTEKVEEVSEAEAVEPTEEVTEEAATLKEDAPTEEIKVKEKDEVQTGKPLKIRYNKNPQKAPDMGAEFGQDVEASGDYITQKVSDFTPEGFETGIVESENPLVIDITDDTQISYKNELSQKYDGKVGEELSEAIRQDGYDAIVTKYDDGSTGEIVLLKGQRDAIQEQAAKEAAPVELKEGEIDITTVFKNPVEKNNEQAVAASNEFKDKAGEYDEGVNDPKFKEENTTVEEISVDDIVPTQEKLFEKNLKSPSEGEPLVMKVGDKYYVEDGHHRIGNGINADNQTVSVRVYESDKAKQDAIQEQEAADVPKVEQPEAVQEVEGEVREPAREAEETKDTKEAEEEEITEEEKVKAAKENLNNVWEKWKQSQKNLGVAFDPKSKANEDMELLEAFVSYIQAIGAKTAKDIQKAFNDFTGGEATLDEAGAEFVAESVKEPVTKKTDKELSREVTFTNIYDIIEKVEKRTPKKANPKEVNKRAYQNAYDYLLKSDWFASATDTEQTEAIDDLKKLTKQRRESSPSAKKILGIDSTKEKISVDQKTVRSWMMQDLAKGYKLGKRDAKKVMSAMARLKNSLENELVGAMREIQSSGKLSKKQVDAIVNKFQKTNVFNPDAVESFLNYMQKVVDKADYVDAVSKANSTRKQIKRRMKNKDVDNNLVQAAKEFAKINPSKVDDIDAYNQLAEKIKEGLGFSMNSKQGVKFRSAFDISTVEEYSELELKRQKLASDAAFEEMFKEMYGLEERAELVNKIKELKR